MSEKVKKSKLSILKGKKKSNNDSSKITFFDEKWVAEELIGEGSFGKVYKAKKEEFGLASYSAIKTIKIPQHKSEIEELKNEGLSNEEIREYFQNFVKKWLDEIKLMQNLKSCVNVVNVEDYEVIESPNSISWNINIRMELLQSIESYFANKKVTNKDIIKLGINISRALEHCKKANIIHRDIKPDNIFINDIGEYKLGDFGIARNLEKTTSGLSKKGTYTYMAPEVYKGEKYNATIDIYSLGILMYRFFNYNRIPFLPPYPQKINFEDREESILKRMNGEDIIPPFNATKEETEIILKTIEFNPKKRYDNPSTLRKDLEKLYDNVDERILFENKDGKLKEIDVEKTEIIKQNEIKESENIDKTVSIFSSDSKRDKAAKNENLDKTVSIYSEKKDDKSFEDNLDRTVSIYGKRIENDVVEKKENIGKPVKPKKKINRALVIVANIFLLVIISTLSGYFYFKSSYVKVPDVEGMLSSEAIELLKDNNIVEDIVEEKVDDDNIGKVISQEKKNVYVKKESIIKLTIGVSDDEVMMVNLVGLNVEEAKAKLSELQLVASVNEDFSDAVETGKVISQNVEENKEITKGSVVEILVSKGKKVVPKTSEELKKTSKHVASKWSDWVSKLPGNVTSSKFDIETQTQYRYRDKQTTTSGNPSMNGWTKYDEKVEYGAWSANKTSKSKITKSDTIDIVKTETIYQYYHYKSWYDNQWNVDSIYINSSSAYCEFETVWNMPNINFSDRGGKQMVGSIDGCGDQMSGWFRKGSYTNYTYKERSKTATYYFYRWGEWSSWSKNAQTANDNREVEKRVMYRYR